MLELLIMLLFVIFFIVFCTNQIESDDVIIHNKENEMTTCVCVLRTQCDNNFNLITNGDGIINERRLRSLNNNNNQLETAECENRMEICCRIPATIITNKTTSTSTSSSSTNVTTVPPPEILVTTKSNNTLPNINISTTTTIIFPPVIFPTIPTLPPVIFPTNFPITGFPTTTTTTASNSNNKCGMQYVSHNAGDLVTDETRFSEYPWMLALLDRANVQPNGTLAQNAFICGASLIGRNVAMTAAHCIKNRTSNSLLIRAGAWNMNLVSEPYQDRLVEMFYVHEVFQNNTLYNDIALLKLQNAVTFAPNIGSVCLPTPPTTTTTTVNFVGAVCIATGWGQDAFGVSGRFQTTLRKVSLRVLEHTMCESELRKTRLGNAFNLHESFVCAGGELNRDTCTGDGGGPLVCRSDAGVYVQVGITSWGIGCGELNTPGVYVRISIFTDWINRIVRNEFNTSL